MPTHSNDGALVRRPGPARSFVHGVGVHARSVHVTREGLAVASAATFLGGFMTTAVGSTFEASAPFAHQGICEISVEAMGASVAPWLVYGAVLGARAAGRAAARGGHRIAETGRADLEQRAAKRSLAE